MTVRPEFTAKMSSKTFLDYYWYKEELVDICRKNCLPTYGTKAELTKYIVSLLEGEPAESLKPRRRRERSKQKIKAEDMKEDTKLLENGFSFNNEARKFFSNYFQVKNFSFKKAMAIKLREVERTKDYDATIKDIINAYLESQNKENVIDNEEERTYQWNNFVRDFCDDPSSNEYTNKMKVASIIWRKVRQEKGTKSYSPTLIKKYSDDIKKYKQE